MILRNECIWSSGRDVLIPRHWRDTPASITTPTDAAAAAAAHLSCRPLRINAALLKLVSEILETSQSHRKRPRRQGTTTRKARRRGGEGWSGIKMKKIRTLRGDQIKSAHIGWFGWRRAPQLL